MLAFFAKGQALFKSAYRIAKVQTSNKKMTNTTKGVMVAQIKVGRRGSDENDSIIGLDRHHGGNTRSSSSERRRCRS